MIKIANNLEVLVKQSKEENKRRVRYGQRGRRGALLGGGLGALLGGALGASSAAGTDAGTSGILTSLLIGSLIGGGTGATAGAFSNMYDGWLNEDYITRSEPNYGRRALAAGLIPGIIGTIGGATVGGAAYDSPLAGALIGGLGLGGLGAIGGASIPFLAPDMFDQSDDMD